MKKQTVVMSAEEFLAAAFELMEARAIPASVAVDELLQPGVLTDEALFQFARSGAVSDLNNEEHRRRGTAGTVREETVAQGVPKFVYRGMTAAEQAERVLAMLYCVGADGTRRSLAAFTIEDWKALRNDCRAQIVGFRARVAVATDAVALLEKRGVQTAAELPTRDRAALARKAVQAWGTVRDAAA